MVKKTQMIPIILKKKERLNVIKDKRNEQINVNLQKNKCHQMKESCCKRQMYQIKRFIVYNGKKTMADLN